jgi:hypothetical protein
MSSFFPKSQRPRLLREWWETPKLLAEELYAMMGSTVPLDEPLEIETPGTEPGLVVRQLGDQGDFGPVIRFTRNGDTTGGIKYFPEDNAYKFVDQDGNPTAQPAEAGTGTQAILIPPQTVYVGRVRSKISGTNYGCWLYPSGTGGDPIMDDGVPPAPQEFTVKALNISTDETIPVDREFPVSHVGPIILSGNRLVVDPDNSQYVMSPPVFMYTS